MLFLASRIFATVGFDISQVFIVESAAKEEVLFFCGLTSWLHFKM